MSNPDITPELEFDYESHATVTLAKYASLRGLYQRFSGALERILSESLEHANVKVHKIESREKSIESLRRKSTTPHPSDPSKPKYESPLDQITDLSAARVITFFPKSIDDVDAIITGQFKTLEKTNKGEVLIEEDRFGYQSVHYLVQLLPSRTSLPEYAPYEGLTGEIQVRTILQHAWAEIEHDIQYHSTDSIPVEIKRRFGALAGMLEIADREFQAIQKEDERQRKQRRESVEANKLEQVEITPDSLKAYLDKRIGPDGRISSFSYEYEARNLKRMGVFTLDTLNSILAGIDIERANIAVWGTKQGQMTKMHDALLAGLGQEYINRHPWKAFDWFTPAKNRGIAKLTSHGFDVGRSAEILTASAINR